MIIWHQCLLHCLHFYLIVVKNTTDVLLVILFTLVRYNLSVPNKLPQQWHNLTVTASALRDCTSHMALTSTYFLSETLKKCLTGGINCQTAYMLFLLHVRVLVSDMLVWWPGHVSNAWSLTFGVKHQMALAYTYFHLYETLSTWHVNHLMAWICTCL
jgi:hypothetical protein